MSPTDLPTTSLGHYGQFVDLRDELRSGEGELEGATSLVVIEGLVTLDTVMGEVRAAQVLGSGDVVALDGDHLPDHEELLAPLVPSRVYVLRDGLEQLVAQQPEIGVKLIRASMERHRRQAVHRAVVQLPALEDRIVGVLWMLADRFGRVTSDGVVVDLPLTHRLLGRLAGATRSAVTTSLGALQRAGTIGRGEDGSYVLDPTTRDAAGRREALTS